MLNHNPSWLHNSLSSRADFLEQFGSDSTSLDPRHSSHGRKQICVEKTLKMYRNDFDWSEESLSPGAGWGEYVEEYEVSLLSFADDFNS